MIIGLDLDNTIVCYDQAIKRLAEELPDLPSTIPKTKLGVRDFLRAEDREDEWTMFQGNMYGPGMSYAEPFPSALSVIAAMQSAGHRTIIISHRTRHPYLGPQHDLHAAARTWIKNNLISNGTQLVAESDIHLNETRDEKVALVKSLACDLFIDDLIEVLTDPAFPMSTEKVWFAPALDATPSDLPSDVKTVSNWADLSWPDKN